MKWLLVLISLLFSLTIALSQSTIYLIPGQGGDARLFNNLQIDSSFTVKHIMYDLPEKDSSMQAYAKQLLQQVDTAEPFILIGVSLGGMLAVEMSEILQPEKTIIISSAKNKNELPAKLKFQQKVPIYKMVPGKLARWGAFILQPIVEYDRNKEKTTFKAMLTDKDPKFLKRTIPMIINWDRTSNNTSIIHIHGDRDHTIPIKNVSNDITVEGGSHMMVLTEGEKLSKIVNEELKRIH